MDENNFNSGPCRPCVRIDINFNDPLKAIEQIKSICKNSKVKQNYVLENTSGDDLTYLMSTMREQIEQDTRLTLMMMFYSDLTFNEQSDFFAFLGHCLNKDIYEASTNNGKKS